ncbi:MAG: ATP-binding protein [Planctomycetota bacterium]|nr:ATP-binding protein [Planctomycetota bacterium]
MSRGSLRRKSIFGLILVVAMLCTLLAGATFGLRSFRTANHKMVDQLPELGAANVLLREAARLDARNAMTPEGKSVLQKDLSRVQDSLKVYFEVLRTNTTRFLDVESKREELDLAFRTDAELTEILRQLNPEVPIDYQFNATRVYLRNHPEVLLIYDSQGRMIAKPLIADRIERLNDYTSELPASLHKGLMEILEDSGRAYNASRSIVLMSTTSVGILLLILARLFRRWVLKPVDLLHFGVLQVAQGQFQHRINLETRDEMQALAEAFNSMGAKLGAMYADLEHQVEIRSRQLVRSERLAGVGFLAAGVAHEINNPLASIAFGAEALESRLSRWADQFPPSESKPVKSYLAMIQEEAFRCKRITERLLDFARGGDSHRERTDVVTLVQSVVDMTRHMGKYRNRSIMFQPRSPLFCDVDGQEIKQVVLNLVVNSLEAIESGGYLIIESHANQGMAEISFTDNGHGMPVDVLDHVFEPFFTRKRTGKGTGLGLSISHRIINQHGGELMAESPGENMGSTFTIRLPLAEDFSGSRPFVVDQISVYST